MEVRQLGLGFLVICSVAAVGYLSQLAAEQRKDNACEQTVRAEVRDEAQLDAPATILFRLGSMNIRPVALIYLFIFC